MGTNPPPPLASEMGPWDFWSSAWALPMDYEDQRAINDGNPTAEQLERARLACAAARDRMVQLVCGLPAPPFAGKPRPH